MPPEQAAPPAPDAPLAQAADRLRSAARWLVISFGAVAAVAFAGISLSRFGDLDPGASPVLFGVAVLGAVAALAGVLGAMVVAMGLAAASTVDAGDLTAVDADDATRQAREAVAGDPVLAPWGHDLGDFLEAVEEAHEDHRTKLDAWVDSADVEAVPDYVNRAAERVNALSGTLDVVLGAASYLRLQARFKVARWQIAGWLALASIGAVAFVWTTGPEASESVPREASTGTWQVPSDDVASLRERMGGTDCRADRTAVPVTVLGEEDDGEQVDLVTTDRGGCIPVRVVVPRTQVALDPVG
ncbi:hypothetical protein [Nocardioides sp. YIM 152588]|uniref:hypothetical protein n=1 Tax=Nocardioides sp. YIM 152588 TaxID=3158259 RepID=UPI0032E417F6